MALVIIAVLHFLCHVLLMKLLMISVALVICLQTVDLPVASNSPPVLYRVRAHTLPTNFVITLMLILLVCR